MDVSDVGSFLDESQRGGAGGARVKSDGADLRDAWGRETEDDSSSSADSGFHYGARATSGPSRPPLFLTSTANISGLGGKTI